MAEATAATEGAKGTKKRKPPMLIVIVLVVVLVAGLGAVKFMGGRGKKAEAEKPKVGATLQLEEFLVNLDGDHYLRMVLALGLREGVSADTLKEKAPEIRHAINMTVAGRRMSELQTAEGKERLGEAIARNVNRILAGEELELGGGTKRAPSDATSSKSDGHAKTDAPVGKSEGEEKVPAAVLEVFYSSFAMQ